MHYNFLRRAFAMGLCLSISAGAAWAFNAVKLIQGNDRETVFILSERPRVTMANGSISVESESEFVNCEMAEGARFEFCDAQSTDVSGIESPDIIFNIGKDNIRGFNLTPFSNVTIVDAAGKIAASAKVADDGGLTVDTSSLPAGVYIFNSIDKNFKFYKK